MSSRRPRKRRERPSPEACATIGEALHGIAEMRIRSIGPVVTLTETKNREAVGKFPGEGRVLGGSAKRSRLLAERGDYTSAALTLMRGLGGGDEQVISKARDPKVIYNDMVLILRKYVDLDKFTPKAMLGFLIEACVIFGWTLPTSLLKMVPRDMWVGLGTLWSVLGAGYLGLVTVAAGASALASAFSVFILAVAAIVTVAPRAARALIDGVVLILPYLGSGMSMLLSSLLLLRRRSEEGPLTARDAADAVDELDDRIEAVDEALSSSGGEEDSDDDRKPLTRGDMGHTRGGGSYTPWRLLDPSQAEFKES